MLGFFLLILSSPSFLHPWSVLNQVPQGGASQLCVVKEKKWMPSCAAWGKTGSISSDWVEQWPLRMSAGSCGGDGDGCEAATLMAQYSK